MEAGGKFSGAKQTVTKQYVSAEEKKNLLKPDPVEP